MEKYLSRRFSLTNMKPLTRILCCSSNAHVALLNECSQQLGEQKVTQRLLLLQKAETCSTELMLTASLAKSEMFLSLCHPAMSASLGNTVLLAHFLSEVAGSLRVKHFMKAYLSEPSNGIQITFDSPLQGGSAASFPFSQIYSCVMASPLSQGSRNTRTSWYSGLHCSQKKLLLFGNAVGPCFSNNTVSGMSISQEMF